MSEREILIIEKSWDLKPWDMLEEGRVILDLRWGGYGTGMMTAVARAKHQQVDGRCLKEPSYTDVRDEPFPKFPVVVMRPGPLPDLPCDVCGSSRERNPHDD